MTAYTLVYSAGDTIPGWILGEAQTGRILGTCVVLDAGDDSAARHWARRLLHLQHRIDIGRWTRTTSGRYMASVIAPAKD